MNNEFALRSANSNSCTNSTLICWFSTQENPADYFKLIVSISSFKNRGQIRVQPFFLLPAHYKFLFELEQLLCFGLCMRCTLFPLLVRQWVVCCSLMFVLIFMCNFSTFPIHMLSRHLAPSSVYRSYNILITCYFYIISFVVHCSRFVHLLGIRWFACVCVCSCGWFSSSGHKIPAKSQTIFLRSEYCIVSDVFIAL